MPVEESLAAEIDSAVETIVERMHSTNDSDNQAGDSGEEHKEKDGEAGNDSEGSEDGGSVDSGSGESRDVLSGRESQGGGEDGDQDSEESDAQDQGEGEGKGSEKAVKVGSSQISDAVLSQAILAGIPISDAKGFASDESLLRVVDIVKNAAAEQISDGNQEEEDPFATFPELDPDLYDENVIAAFDAMKGVLKAQHETIKEFRTRQNESVHVSQQAAARDVEQWFDGQVQGLGEDFADALGSGTYASLDRGSSHFAKREAIANKMALLLTAYKGSGQETPPRETVFQEAARLVLGDEFVKVHERKLSRDLQDRASKHLNRANGKKTKQHQSPIEETAAIVDRKFFGK